MVDRLAVCDKKKHSWKKFTSVAHNPRERAARVGSAMPSSSGRRMNTHGADVGKVRSRRGFLLASAPRASRSISNGYENELLAFS